MVPVLSVLRLAQQPRALSQSEDMTRRVIAHLDCDAFYVSVELARQPQLRGRPVIVAGSGPRAVVTTASYEARRFGVGSAMSAAEARRRCPQAVVVPPDMARYKLVSRELWAIVATSLPVLQRMGLDEAYADLTAIDRPLPLLRALIAEVRERTGIQISAGIAPNRLVAKIASDLGKPAGFVAIGREDAARRLADRSVRLIPGIGPKTAERLARLGVQSIGELQRTDEAVLAATFGQRHGAELGRKAFLHDDSPVVVEREHKSRSTETTFDVDVSEVEQLRPVLVKMSARLAEGLSASASRARTVAIKVRLDDWTTVTRARTLDDATDRSEVIAQTALALLDDYAPTRPVRLIGVRVAGFGERAPRSRNAPAAQLALDL